MKKKFKQLAGICAILLASFSAFSQTSDQNLPAWVSDNGYWVVESNTHHPRQHTVRFYDNSHVLVGTTDWGNARLNINRKKIKMQLKRMLESSLELWAKQHPENDSNQLAKKKIAGGEPLF